MISCIQYSIMVEIMDVCGKTGVPPLTPHGSGLAELSMAIGGLAIGVGEFTPMTTLPSIAHGLHSTIAETGIIVSAYALGVVIGAPLLAVLLARIPRRVVLVGLMLVFAIANLASATADSLYDLVIARFVAGVPHGAYFGIAGS